MVELQRTFESRDETVAIYAISYDPVETLRRFSDVHGITYPLLSDVGSAAITALGVLNVTVEQERAAYGRPMEDRHRGIPYPGTVFLDEDGVVVEKRFEQSHRIRPTGATLLKQLLGDEALPPAVSAETASPGVRIAAWLVTDIVSANQLQEVHVRIDLDDGIHLYVDPVPDGFNALEVDLTGDERLRVQSLPKLEGKPFQVEGLSEQFSVIEGTADMEIPFVLLSNRDTAGDPDRPITLEVEISYQACTDSECFFPERATLELPMIERSNPGYESSDPSAVSPLALRRIIEQPRTDAELLTLVNAALAGTDVSDANLREVLTDLESGGFIERNSSGEWSKAR